MKKPESLRELLFATALVGQTEKLATFIDRGRVECRRGANLTFKYHYTLSLVMQGYAGSVDALMIPILAWIAEQQPDLLDRAPNEPFTFESELLDADTADVSIDLDLSELVLVERTGKSEFKATHVPEPVLADAFPGVCGVSLVQGLLDDGVTILPA
ncbi:phage tail protein [Sphingomonas panni]